MFIAASIKTTAQNVGIGNSTPLMKLHVSKSDSAVALFENTDALDVNVSTALYFKTGSGPYPYTGAVKTIGEGPSAARLGLFTYTSTSANQLLERLSITDIGNVGIGTINPAARLHVIKSDSAVALLENTQTLNTNVSTALYFKSGGSLPYTGAIKTIGEGTSKARLGLFTYTSVSGNSLHEQLSITDGGDVGIGVTAPQTALHINPNGAGSLLIGTNRSSGGYTNIEIGINAQTNGYGYVQATKASGTSYGSLVLNPNGGNVGVGTTTPTSTLDVHGGISLPIKVITASYTVQNGDYTIVVDMQNDSNKVVEIYLPPQYVNDGRIVKIVAINMKSTFNFPDNHGVVKIYNSSGLVFYESLYSWDKNKSGFESGPNAHTFFEVIEKHESATLQCIAVSGWIITDMWTTFDRFESIY